jgi:hypothetical protein
MKFGEIFIEVDGKLTNIKDLDKPDYEWFLESMRATMIAYYVLKENK